MESNIGANDISVWCHICNINRTASFNRESDEYQCTSCSSSFVEESNQGVEEFVSPSTNNSNNNNINISSASTQANIPSEPLRDAAIQHIIDRVLGMTNNNNVTSSQPASIISVIQQSSSGSGETAVRPMGIIIRQSTISSSSTTTTTTSGDNILTTNREDNNNNNRGGIFGLLSSLSTLRQSVGVSESLENNQFEQFLHHILMNESSHAGAPPATEQAITNLDRIIVTTETNISSLGDCCISQDAFEVGDTVIALPCGHNYKEEPIVHWLKMHNTCPVCRIDINSNKNSENINA